MRVRGINVENVADRYNEKTEKFFVFLFSFQMNG